MGLVTVGAGDDGAAELPEQLGNGDGDQLEESGAGVGGALECRSDGDEDVGEQADRGPAVPGGPGGDLPGVQPGDLLRDLVVFLGFPARDRDLDQRRGRDRARGPAQETADRPGVTVLSQESASGDIRLHPPQSLS